MTKGLRSLAAAFLAVAAVGIGTSPAAKAGLFLSVTDGTNTYTTYDSSNNLVGVATVGRYKLTVEIVNTNFPGDPTSGTLGTTTTINSIAGTGTSTDLTVTAEVVDSATYNAVTMQYTAGPLSTFTQPTGNVYLMNKLTSNTPLGTGTATGTSYANGAPLSNSVTASLGADTTTASLGALTGYTLYNTTVLHGLNANLSGASFAESSAVLAPEPATLAMAASALPVLALALRRRRRGN